MLICWISWYHLFLLYSHTHARLQHVKSAFNTEISMPCTLPVTKQYKQTKLTTCRCPLTQDKMHKNQIGHRFLLFYFMYRYSEASQLKTRHHINVYSTVCFRGHWHIPHYLYDVIYKNNTRNSVLHIRLLFVNDYVMLNIIYISICTAVLPQTRRNKLTVSTV